MAFNIFKWILGSPQENGIQTGTVVEVKDFLDNSEDVPSTGIENVIQRMAFQTAVQKIGSAVAAVEWETKRRGKDARAKEYWAWNYSPNVNQTREEFFQDLIFRLFSDEEALIVETRNGNRYVAESFTVTPFLDGDIYQDISARGESIPGTFRASDVLHISLKGDSSGLLSGQVASNQGRLIKSATSNYLRGQGTRGILEIDDTAEADPKFQETYNDLVQNQFKSYFNNANAVLPLYKGYEFRQTDTSGGSTKSSIVGSRDIRNMMNDIIELTAQALGIPATIITGKGVSEADFKQFMTATVQPIVAMLADEINRKLFGHELVNVGTYVVPNYSRVRYTDVFDVANPIDKLIGSGAFCVNDVRIRLGLDIIEEDWAWQHWMTKNYSPTEELLEGVNENTTPETAPEENATPEEAPDENNEEDLEDAEE